MAPPNCSHAVADRAMHLVVASGQKDRAVIPAMPGSGLAARGAGPIELGGPAGTTQQEPTLLCQARPLGIRSRTNAVFRCHARLRIARQEQDHHQVWLPVWLP